MTPLGDEGFLFSDDDDEEVGESLKEDVPGEYNLCKNISISKLLPSINCDPWPKLTHNSSQISTIEPNYYVNL